MSFKTSKDRKLTGIAFIVIGVSVAIATSEMNFIGFICGYFTAMGVFLLTGSLFGLDAINKRKSKNLID